MPRIGLAWKPLGRSGTVIRAGSGVFLRRALAGVQQQQRRLRRASRLQHPRQRHHRAVSSQGRPPRRPHQPRTRPRLRRCPRGPGRRPRSRLRRSQNGASATPCSGTSPIQQDVGRNSIVEVSYLGTVGHKLNGPDTNINQVRPELMGAGQCAVPPPVPAVRQCQHGGAHVGQLLLPRRQLQVREALFRRPQPAGQLHFLEVHRRCPRRPGNRRRRPACKATTTATPKRPSPATMSAIASPSAPCTKSPSAKAASTSRWSRGACLRGLEPRAPSSPCSRAARSASPRRPTPSTLSPAASGSMCSATPTCLKDQRTVQRWFDTDAVVAPPQFTFGNANRALLTGPGLSNLNLSLLKNFKFAETWNLQFRLEVLQRLEPHQFPGTRRRPRFAQLRRHHRLPGRPLDAARPETDLLEKCVSLVWPLFLGDSRKPRRSARSCRGRLNRPRSPCGWHIGDGKLAIGHRAGATDLSRPPGGTLRHSRVSQ